MTEWNFGPDVICRARELAIGDRVAVHWSEAECQDQEATVVGVYIERHGRVNFAVHIDGDASPTDGFIIDHTGRKGGSIRLTRAYVAAQHAVAPVEPVGWRWLIEETMPGGAIRWQVVEHEHDARSRAAALSNAVVTPLYAQPPAPVVTDAMVERAVGMYAKARYGGTVIWPRDFSPKEIAEGRENMRAALTAALTTKGDAE